MGCGKSSIGKRLSELLCCRFMDLDQVIEESEGRSIPEIFATDGEEEFRRLEKEALESVLSQDTDILSDKKPRMVLALGGGTVMTPECAESVREKTLSIYLLASVDTLVERLTGEAAGRPLLAGADSERPGNPSVMSGEVETSVLRTRILELMSKRAATYERVAHLTVDTDGKSAGEIAGEISNQLPHLSPQLGHVRSLSEDVLPL